MDLEKYKALFVDEAGDHLAEMGHALARLEGAAEAEAAGAIDALFRLAHSIKGMASSLDYEPVASLAHRLEDRLEPLRREGRLPDAALPLLYRVISGLERMVGEVAEGRAPAPAPGLIEELERPLADTADDGGGASAPAGFEAPPLPRSVRVRTETIDRFLVAVGELMQRQARLESLHRAAPFRELAGEFADELAGIERVTWELRRRALDIRTTPVRRVLERLPRVASELARALGKRVELTLQGDEVEVDRAVLDHLDDALLHLVRNAVDHGIEPQRAREAAGKDRIGHMSVSASRTAGRLRLRLEDDGAGLDVEAVRRRAVERGMLPEMAEDLSLERIAELIFEPGMSTRDEVSEISGRGVGLDAVKRSIEGLGGSIRMESAPGSGTAFEIDLPSMVALQRVLVLELRGERVALPLARVESIVDASEGAVERIGREAFWVWKDEPVPLVDLAEHLMPSAGASPPGGSVLLIETRDFRFGLRVDRVAADHEVFVREVPEALAGLPALAGVAILNDGEPVFLLDAGVLVESVA